MARPGGIRYAPGAGIISRFIAARRNKGHQSTLQGRSLRRAPFLLYTFRMGFSGVIIDALISALAWIYQRAWDRQQVRIEQGTSGHGPRPLLRPSTAGCDCHGATAHSRRSTALGSGENQDDLRNRVIYSSAPDTAENY